MASRVRARLQHRLDIALVTRTTCTHVVETHHLLLLGPPDRGPRMTVYHPKAGRGAVTGNGFNYFPTGPCDDMPAAAPPDDRRESWPGFRGEGQRAESLVSHRYRYGDW